MAKKKEKVSAENKQSKMVDLVGWVEVDELSPNHFLLLPYPGADHYLRIPKPNESPGVTIVPPSAPDEGKVAARVLFDLAATVVESVFKTGQIPRVSSFLTGHITANHLHRAIAQGQLTETLGTENIFSLIPGRFTCPAE